MRRDEHGRFTGITEEEIARLIADAVQTEHVLGSEARARLSESLAKVTVDAVRAECDACARLADNRFLAYKAAEEIRARNKKRGPTAT